MIWDLNQGIILVPFCGKVRANSAIDNQGEMVQGAAP